MIIFETLRNASSQLILKQRRAKSIEDIKQFFRRDPPEATYSACLGTFGDITTLWLVCYNIFFLFFYTCKKQISLD
jgi:hypothetical protein